MLAALRWPAHPGLRTLRLSRRLPHVRRSPRRSPSRSVSSPPPHLAIYDPGRTGSPNHSRGALSQESDFSPQVVQPRRRWLFAQWDAYGVAAQRGAGHKNGGTCDLDGHGGLKSRAIRCAWYDSRQSPRCAYPGTYDVPASERAVYLSPCSIRSSSRSNFRRSSRSGASRRPCFRTGFIDYPLYQRQDMPNFRADRQLIFASLPVKPPVSIAHTFSTADSKRSITLAPEFLAVTETDYDEWPVLRPQIENAAGARRDL